MMNTDKRGFASLSHDRLREIAQQGGQAAHRKGTAHEFTVEEARAAGRKGGYAVSRNRAHMVTIGRKGGQTSASHIRSSARTVRTPQPVESHSK